VLRLHGRMAAAVEAQNAARTRAAGRMVQWVCDGEGGGGMSDKAKKEFWRAAVEAQRAEKPPVMHMQAALEAYEAVANAERAELVAALRAMVERMEEDLDEMASERGFPAVPISWLESPPLATARALLARIDGDGGI